jgi:AcrR family transcriptional regulator
MIADKQDVLLAAAVACMATQGFQVPSLTLAQAAHVGEGTLYRTFSDKAALLAATYPYVLAQLTAPLAAAGPRPGERLQAVLARWWEATALAALAQPAVFACWRLWRGAAQAPPESVYGPFARVRPLLQQALGRLGARRQGRLPAGAVVPLLAGQWLVAVELAQAALALTPQAEPASQRPLLQALYASWWASTGWEAELAAEPVVGPLTGIAALQHALRDRWQHADNGDF